MLSIVSIERFYRHQLAAERLTHLQGELSAMSDALYRLEDGRELIHLTRAERHLQLAVKEILEAQNEARIHCQEALLESHITASIELVNRSPERLARKIAKRAEEKQA